MLRKLLRRRAHRAAGANTSPQPVVDPTIANVLLRDYASHPAYARLIAYRLHRSGKSVLLLCGEAEWRYLESAMKTEGLSVTWRQWEFGRPVDTYEMAPDSLVVAFKVPGLPEHWVELQALRERFGSRLLGINELLLPISVLLLARSKLPYSVQNLDELLVYYVGQSTFGAPLQNLADAFLLKGKSVIEFGPLDGSQTAFLVHSGASRVTCVEARPENAMKVIAARQALGWNNVEVRMDDFHSVDANNAGRFDLAFAHGVYYHSISPFVFLENLISLADHVYLGGYCATEENPEVDFLHLEHKGKSYRVKKYAEGGAGDFFAGINSYAYYFEAGDLLAFFHRNGYETRVFEDLSFGADTCAGRYVRFLATRKTPADNAAEATAAARSRDEAHAELVAS